ncbi:DUF4345 domain-containing protein [Mycobacterium sp. PS03-16]|uniref:DUF4345 domain-containing protein n=1 Tax=Mycobacterium sp. PS03-16 TaxID=2559611 RepID=UPI001FD7AB48|nr:DUF4345 domain-containing protein [Mycobacterium sp. PS03-16]
MAAAVIVVVAVFFAGMGCYALAAPAALIRPFGIDVTTGTARSEVRAVYGGFGLGVTAVLLAALWQDGPVRTGVLITVGAALAGMAGGRVIAAVLGDRTTFYPNWFYCGVEAAAAAALFAIA